MSMTQEEALQWVATLFEEPKGKIHPGTARESIEAWDSLGMLTLMAGLNDKFDIVMTDEELQSFRTVDDILQVLRRNGKME